ncbi:hypothetical protein ACFVT5_40920 [Streptomyces sp. NPDC058001]|uniref:hypothetical protein n=1 Tax=Streptomyces sp. NPDC058001 TaxID=3346300 RepID=UPI0036E5886E
MTGPEHYTEAERHLSAASYLNRPGGRPVDPAAAAHQLAMAQAHATLALAAATAMGAPVEDDLAGLTVEEHDAWYAVAGTKPGASITEEATR